MYAELRIPIQPPTEALAARLATYNEAVADLDRRAAARDEAERGILHAVDASMTPQDLRNRLEALRDQLWHQAVEASQLAAQRLDLLETIAEAAQKQVPKLERQLDKAREEADKAMRAAGAGPERHPDYEQHKQIREHQFRFEVNATRNVREAAAALDQMRGTHKRAREEWSRHEQLEQMAHADLQEAARRILGIPKPATGTTPRPAQRRAAPLGV